MAMSGPSMTIPPPAAAGSDVAINEEAPAVATAIIVAEAVDAAAATVASLVTAAESLSMPRSVPSLSGVLSYTTEPSPPQLAVLFDGKGREHHLQITTKILKTA